MRVVWDEVENLANQAKHGVSLEDAGLLFSLGVDYLEVFDEVHSDTEDRFIAIGPIQHGVARDATSGSGALPPGGAPSATLRLPLPGGIGLLLLFRVHLRSSYALYSNLEFEGCLIHVDTEGWATKRERAHYQLSMEQQR